MCVAVVVVVVVVVQQKIEMGTQKRGIVIPSFLPKIKLKLCIQSCGYGQRLMFERLWV